MKALRIAPELALPLDVVTEKLAFLGPVDLEDLLRRFWAFVEPEPNSGCWLWTGANVRGYGVLALGAPSRRKILVTRLSYMVFVGPLAADEKACHSCDNPPCCNPAHLFRGTQIDNMRDASVKGRLIGRPVGRGERHHRSRLTTEAVLLIRSRYSAGEHAPALAEQFAITLQGVMAVIHRKTWKHIA